MNAAVNGRAGTVEARVPPHDLDTEAAVLCACLLDTSAFERVSGILEAKHFYADANRWIYAAIAALASAGQPIDARTLTAWLRDHNRLAQIGGTPYLAQISDATPAVAHVEAHAEIVREKWRTRQLIATCQRAVVEGYAGADAGTLRRELTAGMDAAEVVAPVARRAASSGDVIQAWRTEGPLRHEPTGIVRLDELTGGGPVYGTRWYLAGAPDAGKTALLIQLAHVFALRGIAVGLLAVDEDAADLVTRVAQRLGYARHACEARDAMELADLLSLLEPLPLRFYSAEWTIEAAAADLSAWARERTGGRAMLGIDSVQTVTCEADVAALASGRELSEVAAVTARSRAIRAAATSHRLIAIATSELGRSAYRSSDPGQQTSTLASAKWSGAIEYSARVLVGLRSVGGEKDLVDLEIAKNKHGPRDEHVYLRIDRSSQTLIEVASYQPPPAKVRDRDGAARERAEADGVAVARILRDRPGIGLRELRGAMRGTVGAGHDRVEAGLAVLGEAVVRVTGPRGAKPMSLDLERLPQSVRQALEVDHA